MKYPIVHDSQWVKPKMKGYRMRCCDCSLVHVLTFKIVRSGRGLAVKFKASRHVRATAQSRRDPRNRNPIIAK